MTFRRSALIWVAFLVAAFGSADLSAQQPAPQQPAGRQGRRAGSLESIRPTYTLGVGDQITIHAPGMEEINDNPYRIDSEGNINLPVLGKIPAAGVTVEQLESTLTERLRPLITNPQVVVSVVEYRSEPIFFTGAFNTPGIYTLQGRRKLVEMLATVGGLQPDASRIIKITRRLEYGVIPLPNAMVDREAGTSSVEMSLTSLTENVNPAEDMVLQPFDVIHVDPAEMVYVNGEVGKVGGFQLRDRDSMSVTQALAMAGGLGKDAAPEKATILRPILNTSRRAEIPINIKRILAGKDRDYPLMPNDVLYVPPSNSIGKRITPVMLIAMPVLATIIPILILR